MERNETKKGVEKLALYDIVPEWSIWMVTIFIVTAFLIGLPGNILVVLVQIRNAKKNVTDWFVTFLAASDIVILSVCVPASAVMYTGAWKKYGFVLWCRLFLFIQYGSLMFSTMLIVNTGIDRYIKTMNKHFYTRRKALYSSLGILLASMFVGAPNLAMGTHNSAGQCVINPASQKIHLALYIILLVVEVVSLLATTFIYTRIVLTIKRSMKVVHHAPPSAPSQHGNSSVFRNRIRALKTTKTMGAITLTAMISAWLPGIGAVFLSSTNNDATAQARNTAVFFLLHLHFFNTFSNPLFYFYMHSAFRVEAKSVVKRIWKAIRRK
jgi:hypothetical protein